MRQTDWKEYNRLQRARRLLQEQDRPSAYAPRAIAEDAFEQREQAAQEAERRIMARANSAISEIFANAATNLKEVA